MGVCSDCGAGWTDMWHGAFDKLELSYDMVYWLDDTYFYLDSSQYAVSPQGFYPSHNPMTGEVNEEQYYHMKYQFPLYRAQSNKRMFEMAENQVFMLIACDINDQYGLAAMAGALA